MQGRFDNIPRSNFVNLVTFPAIARRQKPKCGLAHRRIRTARVVSQTMSAKYYTQFKLTDADYRGGNEFSGVVELSRPMDHDSDATDIEAVLAKNFDLQQSAVQLVSWSRLH